ncbi:DUF3367 domain-containing protein [Corynebacterium alimapuense]|uniref:DUF3367 domain-containing protein n=1 Tax=Corynebacterium alimapuense TaxID=1576874 RepID=UPI001FE7FBA4|nr:DUF3367 domain-containing protein [Corynebacterium alimapuense]
MRLLTVPRFLPKAQPHLLGWVFLTILVFLQPAGFTSADTKHDLTANPAGFLAGALHAWTDTFTLGQLQNQAYGYLFPHGLFFLITDGLPDWLAQRLWWTLVLGVGYSGFLLLSTRLRVGSPGFRILAALLYALSPRGLSTLSTISSETWPVMLAPWVIIPLLGRLDRRAIAAAVLPVAAMGAVNATATLAACLPAGIVLVWRILRRDQGALAATAAWLAGCLFVSLWWIGPLLILGRYSAPFTDFIESSFVTTRWLNLVEILRGTTSWAPFADSERVAGTLLVSEPVFILLTVAVAALGLWGLGLAATPHRQLWTIMLLSGVAVLGVAHGPLGPQWLEFLDGPGVALRNLHKFDPLVRIPLLIGVAGLGAYLRLPATRGQWVSPGRREAAGVLVCLIAAASMAPAWSGRLLPLGAYEQVPDYWSEASTFLNEEASETRTLIVPETSFARQDWGWTRDEPAQPLLEVPWAVRDAVPLIDPEAIRGLDGVMSVLHHDPETGVAALRRLGIGAVLIRHDLAEDTETIDADAIAEATGASVESFGDQQQVEIILFDPVADLMITSEDPVRVAGGGEILALIDARFGSGPRLLVDHDAEVVTDTPMLTVRNYGTLQGAVSAPLADLAEGADVRNAVPNYPSVGPYTQVIEHGGHVSASSSAADATSFGGADPARSMTAAVDNYPETAWWPTPGTAAGQWLELQPDLDLNDPVVTITATADTVLLVNDTEVELVAEEPTEVMLEGNVEAVRLTLSEPGPVGIAEVAIEGAPIERIVTVPDTSPNVSQFLFQRLAVDTGVIIREFTAPTEMTLLVETAEELPITVDGVEYLSGDILTLEPGTHQLFSDAEWVSLASEGADPSPLWSATGQQLEPSELDRLLITGRAANPGLQAELAGSQLEPITIDAATQAFIVPAGAGGQVRFSFAGDSAYRGFLFGGGLLALVSIVVALIVLSRTRAQAFELDEGQVPGLAIFGGMVITLVAGWPGLLAGLVTYAILRITIIPGGLLAAALLSISGAWLARSPWPSGTYAGDSEVVMLLCVAALASLLATCLPQRAAGASTKR